MTIRKLLFGTIAALMLATSPAMAYYTECSAKKDIELSIRPDGPSDPRWPSLKQGDKVGFRNSYRGWWFIVASDSGTYGWIRRSDLTDCKPHEGTP
jgi:hypothetical protein